MPKGMRGWRFTAVAWQPMELNGSFATHDDLLAAAVHMLNARTLCKNVRYGDDEEVERPTEAYAKRFSAQWYQNLRNSPDTLALVAAVRKHRLNRLQTEILTTLTLSPLGLLDTRVSDTDDLLKALALPSQQTLTAMRALSETGRLYRSGLIGFTDPDEDPLEREVSVNPEIVDTILNEGAGRDNGIRTEAELHAALARLVPTMKHTSEAMARATRGIPCVAEFRKWRRKQEWMFRRICDALAQRQTWSMSQVRGDLDDDDWMLVLALVGKAMRYVSDDDLFNGAGLARIVCRTPRNYGGALRRLTSQGALISRGLIQPCGGSDYLLSDAPDEIQETEFELTHTACKDSASMPRGW